MNSDLSPDDMASLAIRRPDMFPNKLQPVQRIEHTLNRPHVENPEQDFYMGPIVKDITKDRATTEASELSKVLPRQGDADGEG